MKPIKAWAVVDETGALRGVGDLCDTRREARELLRDVRDLDLDYAPSACIVPVEIRELPKRRTK